MNIEEYREYCLSIKGATSEMCIRDSTKCDSTKSTELMELYNGIAFGPFSDKKHWITIYLESDVPDSLIKELINHSIEEVIKKLPKKKQQEYRSTLGIKDEN